MFYEHTCKCGCGGKIPKKEYHSKCKNYKIPEYIHGHYFKNKKRPDHSLKMSGKNNPMYGKYGKESSAYGHLADKAPNWTGGDTGYWSTTLRKKYKKCSLCGSNGKLLVHHKDGNRKNNSRKNLIVTCHPCHEFWHKRSTFTG